MCLLNHLATTSRGAGSRRTRNGSSTKFGILDGAFGTGLTDGSAGFSGGFFSFRVKNLSWFRGANRFFDCSTFLLLSKFLFFLQFVFGDLLFNSGSDDLDILSVTHIFVNTEDVAEGGN